MMPAHRHAHMIEALALHGGELVGGNRHAPFLARRHFQAIAEVGAAQKQFCRAIRRRVVAGVMGFISGGFDGLNAGVRLRAQSDAGGDDHETNGKKIFHITNYESLVTFSPSYASITPGGNSACARSWS